MKFLRGRRDAMPPRRRPCDLMRVFEARERTASVSRRYPFHTGRAAGQGTKERESCDVRHHGVQRGAFHPGLGPVLLQRVRRDARGVKFADCLFEVVQGRLSFVKFTLQDVLQVRRVTDASSRLLLPSDTTTIPPRAQHTFSIRYVHTERAAATATATEASDARGRVTPQSTPPAP